MQSNKPPAQNQDRAFKSTQSLVSASSQTPQDRRGQFDLPLFRSQTSAIPPSLGGMKAPVVTESKRRLSPPQFSDPSIDRNVRSTKGPLSSSTSAHQQMIITASPKLKSDQKKEQPQVLTLNAFKSLQDGNETYYLNESPPSNVNANTRIFKDLHKVDNHKRFSPQGHPRIQFHRRYSGQTTSEMRTCKQVQHRDSYQDQSRFLRHSFTGGKSDYARRYDSRRYNRRDHHRHNYEGTYSSNSSRYSRHWSRYYDSGRSNYSRSDRNSHYRMPRPSHRDDCHRRRRSRSREQDYNHRDNDRRRRFDDRVNRANARGQCEYDRERHYHSSAQKDRRNNQKRQYNSGTSSNHASSFKSSTKFPLFLNKNLPVKNLGNTSRYQKNQLRRSRSRSRSFESEYEISSSSSRRNSDRRVGGFQYWQQNDRRQGSKGFFRPGDRRFQCKKGSFSSRSPMSNYPDNTTPRDDFKSNKMVSSESSSRKIDRSKDADHFEWYMNQILNSRDGTFKYKIVGHLGDGTFGRALKCHAIPSNEICAVKVVRAVKRYTESAQIEADILVDLMRKGGRKNGIVDLKEYFMLPPSSNSSQGNMCLVFEPLGQSLFDFIKKNKYRGFKLSHVRQIAQQSLKAVEFLHSLRLTHTDLKPENILLKNDEQVFVTDWSKFPINVQKKKEIYGNYKYSDDEEEQQDSVNQRPSTCSWAEPLSCEVKIIDFGGATYDNETHTRIINTRQYRAPEVILEDLCWNEKSDLWSMACILIEIYTGELFFDTHENLEHLAMIEKQCGPIPHWMAKQCTNESIKNWLQINTSKTEEEIIHAQGHRLRWPQAARRRESIRNVEMFLPLQSIIKDEFGPEHRHFRDLLASMFKIDPERRPTASECLQHPFFLTTLDVGGEAGDLSDLGEKEANRISKSTEKTQASTDADRNQFLSPQNNAARI